MAHGQEPRRTEGDHDPEDFGPVSRRQAENLARFTIRLAESLQYEKLGRAVAAKLLYLAGAAGLAVWYFLGDEVRHMLIGALLG